MPAVVPSRRNWPPRAPVDKNVEPRELTDKGVEVAIVHDFFVDGLMLNPVSISWASDESVGCSHSSEWASLSERLTPEK